MNPDDVVTLIKNDGVMYVKNVTEYFLKDSKNEEIEEIKKEIVGKKKDLFACFAALALNENDFVTFYDKFDLDINSKNNETKMTPFLCSLLNKEHDVLKIILIKYKDSVNIYDKTADGMTMLHLLAFLHELKREGERILLAYPNLPINEKEKKNSFTPLHLAVMNDNLYLISFLLDKPNIEIGATDKRGNNPFHYVFEKENCYEILKLFFDNSDQSSYLMKKNFKV